MNAKIRRLGGESGFKNCVKKIESTKKLSSCWQVQNKNVIFS
jgi:hypothetical protein